MNFFTLASALLLFQMGLSSPINYCIKLLGFVFMIVAVNEMTSLMETQKPIQAELDNNRFLRKRVKTLCAVKQSGFIMAFFCALSALCIFVISFFDLSKTLLNISSVVLGVATTAMSFNLFRKVFYFIVKNETSCKSECRFFNDQSNVGRLGRTFVKLAIFTGINLLGDIINRFMPNETIASFGGLVAFYSKIIMYIFLLLLVWQLNIIRVDCIKKAEHDNIED